MVSAFVGVGGVGQVLAQNNKAILEEVVVTAERREASIQDVAMSLQTFSSSDLTDIGFVNVSDIVTKTPSLTAAVPLFSQAPHAVRLYMRGVQNTGAESGVAVYFDDVYISNRSSHSMQMADIERVEILKGPQGTLYGRNAVGGAVKFISAKPSGELDFQTKLDIGNFGYVRSLSHLNLPEFSGVSIKLSGLINQRDGWAKNSGEGPDFHEQDDAGVRAAVNWAPNADWRIDYAFDIVDIDDTPPLAQRQFKDLFPGDFPVFPKRQDRSWRPVDTEVAATALQRSHGVSAEYTFSDTLSFKSTTAYMSQDTYLLLDTTEGYNLPNLIERDDRAEQLQQEFLFSGSFTDLNLSYHVGAFYFEEENNSAAVTVVDIPRGNAVPYIPLTVADIGPKTILRAESQSLAFFTHVSWVPGILDDRMTLDLGARYSEDKRQSSGILNTGVILSDGDDKYSSLDPAVTVAYSFMDNVNGYVRYTTAYRAGGFNLYPAGDYVSEPYGKEDVESFEVGFKSEWGDRARINLAAFTSDYTDIQIPITLVATATSPSGQIIRNIGEATINGIEGEFEIAATERLTLGANVTFLDSSEQRTVNPQTLEEFSGRLPQTPEWSYSLSAEYQGRETRLGKPSFYIGYDYTDDKASPEAERYTYPSCRNMDARLSLSGMPIGSSGSVDFALWGKNLTDDECQVFRGFNAVQYVTPRTFGISLVLEF